MVALLTFEMLDYLKLKIKIISNLSLKMAITILESENKAGKNV